jgi:uncharacterized protein YbjQ (UPF0145 family)
MENVNPVTGRIWGEDRGEEMTEEQREQSAAELADLIRRLNANGLIQCKLASEGTEDDQDK